MRATPIGTRKRLFAGKNHSSVKGGRGLPFFIETSQNHTDEGGRAPISGFIDRVSHANIEYRIGLPGAPSARLDR
jgi:hypothetical protein